MNGAGSLMERLKTRDLNQLLQFSQGLLALRSAEDFRQFLLRNLRTLVYSEFSSYGEIDPSRPPGRDGSHLDRTAGPQSARVH